MGNTKNTGRIPAVVTYTIAVVCLLCGLFIPLGNVEGFNVENMLAMQLPSALGSAFGIDSLITVGQPFTYSFAINFFGLGASIDLGAYLVLFYTLMTVAALIMLIPVIVIKKPYFAVKLASAIETITLAILAILLFLLLEAAVAAGAAGATYIWSYAVIIAFFGTLVMLMVQAVIYKGGSGVIKIILFLLSAAAVLFVIYPIVYVVPALQDPVTGLANALNSDAGLFSTELPLFNYGIAHANALFAANYGEFFSALPDVNSKVLAVFTLIASILIFANFLLDLMGLGKRTNRFMVKCNVVRYALELAAIIGMLVMILVGKRTCGVMFYFLAIVTVLALVINVIRLILAASKRSKQKEAVAEMEEEAQRQANADANAELADNAEDSGEQLEITEAEPAAADEVPAEQQQTIVYNVNTIYNGPSDEFIRKLSNEEKVEFAKIFLERSLGNLSFIPDYIVGGENSKFFLNIFIHYSRIRGIVSDGLMNKMYEQVNMLD